MGNFKKGFNVQKKIITGSLAPWTLLKKRHHFDDDMNFSPNDMNADQLNQLGFLDDNQNFDPSGAIVNEAIEMGATRGRWAEQNGNPAIFSINAYNATSDIQQAELFGASNSIVEIPNNSVYAFTATASGIPYRPCTTEQLLMLIGVVANTAEAGEAAICPRPMVIWDDTNGNLVWIDPGVTGGTTYFPMSQWSAFFTSQAPLVATTNGVNVILSCPQRPYRALMMDLKDLVLYIRKVRVKYSNVDGIPLPMSFNRVKSFGGADSNTAEPQQFQTPMDQQNNIVDIDIKYFVDKLTTMYIQLAPYPGANLASLTAYTFWVNAYKNNGVSF